MRFYPFHLFFKGYVQSLKLQGHVDFNDLLKITEAKLTNKVPLWQGDTFSDLERWIFIDNVDSGLISFLAGNPSNPKELQMFSLPLEELQDACMINGVYEIHYMYIASNYQELKSKYLTSKKNEN